MAALTPQSRALFRQYLSQRFTRDELEELAFDLGLNHEEFDHDSLSEFVRQLIIRCENDARLPALMAAALARRSDPAIQAVHDHLVSAPSSTPAIDSASREPGKPASATFSPRVISAMVAGAIALLGAAIIFVAWPRGNATPMAQATSTPQIATTSLSTPLHTPVPTLAPTTTPTLEISPTATAQLDEPAALGTPVALPDARITAGNAKQLRLLARWNTGKGVTQLSWSPDGSMIAIAGFASDGTSVLELRNALDGQVVRRMKQVKQPVRSLAFSPDGKHIIAGLNNKLLQMWQVNNGNLVRSFTGHDDNVTAVAFSPDGGTFASASDDKTALLWDASTGQVLTRMILHTEPVVSVAFSPDGRYLATGSRDNTAKLWDAQTGALMLDLEDHSGWVWALAFSPDSDALATATTDGQSQVWRVGNGQLLGRLNPGHDDATLSIAYNPAGDLIVTGGKDRRVIVEQWQARQVLFHDQRHHGFVASVAFSPDGRLLASGGEGGLLLLWGVP